MRALFWFLGLLNVGNGLWMLLEPTAWYHDLPAGVPDTGPLNLHFVRDIGSAFLTIGVALCAAAVRPALRHGVALATALFLVLHAVVHVTDLVGGRLPASHWLVDLPGVFFPAALFVVLAMPRWWREARR
jgi:hypothetical protein